jgi:hypothetical protein
MRVDAPRPFRITVWVPAVVVIPQSSVKISDRGRVIAEEWFLNS